MLINILKILKFTASVMIYRSLFNFSRFSKYKRCGSIVETLSYLYRISYRSRGLNVPSDLFKIPDLGHDVYQTILVVDGLCYFWHDLIFNFNHNHIFR